jgi:GTPase Era involved in 16S rRNA processing
MLKDEAFKKDKILLENQNFKNKIDLYKNKALDVSIKEFLKDTKHINVILLGKTGVGKSSLINAPLQRNEADTGGFTPVTNEIKFYHEDHLRLYDTIGIELSNERSATKILEEIKKLIEDNEKKSPDWFIHCIWYCISGDRFEPKEEGKVVDELMNTYKDGKYPIIFAYLQAVDHEAIVKMQKGLQDLYPNIDFIPIIARDIKSSNGMQIPKMNLNKIKEMTINKFGESINSMSFIYIQNKVKQRVRQEIDNLICEQNLNYLSNTICNVYQKLLDQLNEKDKNEIFEEVKFIINYSREKLDFNDDIMNYIN